MSLIGEGSDIIPAQGKVQIDVNDLTDVKCNNCGCEYFKLVFRIKRLSALISPTGKEAYVPGEVMVCTSCGKELNNDDENLIKN